MQVGRAARTPISEDRCNTMTLSSPARATLKLKVEQLEEVSFKNSHDLRKVVANTPLNRMLLETDSPYLAPIPNRGKPCHSGYIPFIAEEIAQTINVSVDEVYETIRQNTRDMYGV